MRWMDRDVSQRRGRVLTRSLRPHGFTSGVVAPSSLLTGLVAYWKLDEVSGTRTDSAGANNLTDFNTVTQTTGVVSKAAEFTLANSECLTITDNAALSIGIGTSFECAGWFNLTTKATTQAIYSKDGNPPREYILRYETAPTDRMVFYVRNIGNTVFTSVTATSFGSPSTGTWYFFDTYYDVSTGLIGIAINNGTVNTANHGTGGVFDSTAPFDLGRHAGGLFLNGALDEIGFWKGLVLSSGQRTSLYNSGGGVTHPFTGLP